MKTNPKFTFGDQVLYLKGADRERGTVIQARQVKTGDENAYIIKVADGIVVVREHLLQHIDSILLSPNSEVLDATIEPGTILETIDGSAQGPLKVVAVKATCVSDQIYVDVSNIDSRFSSQEIADMNRAWEVFRTGNFNRFTVI